MSLQFSLNSSKYVHSWTLAVNKILILIKFPFQRYISCRHLTFDPTYEIGCHGNFPPFRKSGILALVDYFGVCTIIFLKFIGRYKNVKQDFFWTQKFLTDSITGGLDYEELLMILKTLVSFTVCHVIQSICLYQPW